MIDLGEKVVLLELPYRHINQKLLKSIRRSGSRDYLLSEDGLLQPEDLDIVYCVVSRNEMKQMKGIINQIDPLSLFHEAHEILGEGFTLDKKKTTALTVNK